MVWPLDTAAIPLPRLVGDRPFRARPLVARGKPAGVNHPPRARKGASTPMFCAKTTVCRKLPAGRVGPDGAVGPSPRRSGFDRAGGTPRLPRIFSVGRAVSSPPLAPKINLSRGFWTGQPTCAVARHRLPSQRVGGTATVSDLTGCSASARTRHPARGQFGQSCDGSCRF